MEMGEYKEILWYKILQIKGVEYLRKHIIETAKEFKPDIVFMQLQCAEPIDIETIKKIKENNNPFIVNFSGDVRQPLPEWFKIIGKEIDLSLFSNYSDVEEMKIAGCNAYFMPAGFNPEFYYPAQKHDIVFFANNYKTAFPLSPLRDRIGTLLKEKYGSRFGLYGGGWDNADGNLFNNPQKESEILRHSKIAINLSQFNLKRYSSDRLERAMGCGTMVLTHRFDELDKFLIEGEHLVAWDNTDDLCRKIDYYLEHEEERAKIARQGCEYAHKNLTWDKVLSVMRNHLPKNHRSLIEAIKNPSKEKKYCQTFEEGILKTIFNHIGTTNKYLVDFGAGDGIYLSNSRALIEAGWTGLLMDGDNKGNEQVKKEFITAENINDLFVKYDVPQEFDLLSIDVDGNDYWIWNELNYYPRVVMMEFNPSIQPGEAKTIKYNPSHTWGNDTYYGASFDALKKLGKEKGYTLVGQCADLNMFFVRSDIIPQQDFGVTYNVRFGHAKNTTGQWIDVGYFPMPYALCPFNNDRLIQKEILRLRDKYGIKTAVETGSCLFSTTKFLGDNFEKVFTIELNKKFYDEWKWRVENNSNVFAFNGDSPFLLSNIILNNCNNKTLIFLDAHWGNDCPLQNELTVIAERGIKPVIAIHDFVVPGKNEFGFDTYNGQPFTYEWLSSYFDSIYGEKKYGHYYNSGLFEKSAKRGIIYIFPL